MWKETCVPYQQRDQGDFLCCLCESMSPVKPFWSYDRWHSAQGQETACTFY